MATAEVNGVRLFYEVSGSGDTPLVLVHGAWSGHHTWDRLVPHVAGSFRVLTYDRRGHSESERPPGQGSIREDVADLVALIEHLGLAPAWVLGNSFGGLVVLRAAGEHPEVLRGVIAHEPPLFSLIEDDPSAAAVLGPMRSASRAIAERIASGDHAGAAEQFMEMVLGSGAWDKLPPILRQTYIHNAPTFLDETSDPDGGVFDPAWLQTFPRPVLLTKGEHASPFVAPMYARFAEQVPNAQIETIPGAGHAPHHSHPEMYAQMMVMFIQSASASAG